MHGSSTKFYVVGDNRLIATDKIPSPGCKVWAWDGSGIIEATFVRFEMDGENKIAVVEVEGHEGMHGRISADLIQCVREQSHGDQASEVSQVG